MEQKKYVIGIDFGTDSVRSVLIDSSNGTVIASSVFYYKRWQDKLYCKSAENQFRQHPKDYIEGLEQSIRDCLNQVDSSISKQVKGISVDTTGSTPGPVDESGTPLALSSEFENNPNAMFILWKDHTSVKEAAEINKQAQQFDPNYLQYVGGIYSSEWFWAKLLHVLRTDENVRKHCHSWVEHCDWIPFLLTGGKKASDIKRSRCAAGHKALWCTSAEDGWEGLPPDEFFSSLDPLLKGFTQNLYTQTYTADQPAGSLSEEWAERLGLSTDVVVGTGAFDAHMGAVGGQIEPYYLSKVMGTSTCDMLVAPLEEVKNTLVNGICGQVPGSVIPEMMGMEAGQSAFGDVYAWFSKLLQWPLQGILEESDYLNEETNKKIRQDINNQMIPFLSKEASKLPISEKDELAIDWLNGRRTPDANQELAGAITRLSLGSNAPQLFKALVESTCFGARKIVDRFNEQGIQIKGLIGMGGVARKSDYVMQTMADIMNRPIKIHRSDQTCAAGAAMFAATAAGLYPNVKEAMKSMGQGFDKTYQPDAQRVPLYNERYQKYSNLGNFLEKNHF